MHIEFDSFITGWHFNHWRSCSTDRWRLASDTGIWPNFTETSKEEIG